MLRTTIGLSFILVLGGLYACSSKSTIDGNGTGGHGAIVGGTGAGGSSGGSGGNANGAGTTNVSGGKAATGGTGTGTAGIANGACADTTITCVDATTATGCDPATGKVDTFNCVEGYKELGFVSTGCSADAMGAEGCDVTGVSDAACQTGAQVLARCETATADELFNIYVNCFQNNNDGHAVITCFNDFGTAATITANQCLQAEETCFPSAGGAGPGEGGAGGAP